MNNLFFKIYVLIRKDFQEEISYRLNFFLHAGSILLMTTVFYFVAKIFGGGASVTGPLARYGGDYFSFVLIGLAFTGYLSTGLGAFSDAIRTEQMLGTLEVIMTTPTSLWAVLLAKLLWNFIYDSLHLIIYFAFGILFLKAHYIGANLAAIPLILILTLISLNGIGTFSAAFILIYKRGDPLNMFFNFLSLLLGGVYYPVEVMPAILQKASAFLPLTYSLRLMRDACMRGESFATLMPDFVKLLLLCAILTPLSTLFFNYAVRRAKREGTLTHY